MKIHIDTPEVDDRIIIKPKDEMSEEEILELILNEYKKWHHPVIFGFEFINFNKMTESKVKESFKSITRKHQLRIIDQLKVNYRNKIINSFSNKYNNNWSFNSLNFNVDLENPYIVSKCNDQYGIAFTNCKFVLAAFVAEIDILEMNDSSSVFIGLYSEKDKNQMAPLKDANYSISYESTGIIHRYGLEYSSNGTKLRKGDKLIIAYKYKTKELIFMHWGSKQIQFFHRNELARTIEFYIAIGTQQNNCEFRINYWNEEKIKNIATLIPQCTVPEEYLLGHKELSLKSLNMQHVLSDRFMKDLINYSRTNNIEVWDLLQIYSGQYSDYIFSLDYLTIELVYPLPVALFFKGLTIMDNGIHFIEVEANNVSIDRSSLVGVMSADFNLENNDGLYWGYNNNGNFYNRQIGGMNYGKPFKNGVRIGLYLDLDNGVLEFFRNGKSQGIATGNVKGPVRFFVTMASEGLQYKILPSNLDTYFEYMNKQQKAVRYDNFVLADKCQLIDDVKCKVNIGEFKIEAAKKYTRGRQYFEIKISNMNAIINFGMNGYTYEYHIGTKEFDIDEIDLFGDDNYDLREDNVEENVVLGILIDFDERGIQYFRNRILVHEVNYDQLRKMNGYIAGYVFSKINENEDALIEIVTTAYDDMKDMLVLFD